MNHFWVQHFTPDGKPHTLIEGREARHYPDTDTLEIDDVRVRSHDEQGRQAVATARRALSNGDGTEVELMGDARVVREAGGPPGGRQEEELEFRGEYLKVFPDDQRVQSHLPVRLRQGAMVVTANSLKYDHQSRVVDLQGNVHGLLPPK
jgi:lipopolysaccharide export system protein LptC